MTNFERTVIGNQEAILTALSIILLRNEENKSLARLLFELANTCRQIINNDPPT